ncbi:hypothetical protein LTR53_011093 [Teratosphaeriaceae sp. CCFEE 6253]|nr:hypothetical protein LTR53_011093 [Teratosphaeriaceae sp. CCFEE 6253]
MVMCRGSLEEPSSTTQHDFFIASSTAPLLQAEDANYLDDEAAENEYDSKEEGRRVIGLRGNRMEDQEPAHMNEGAGGLMPQTRAAINAMRPDPKSLPQSVPLSPPRHPYPSAIAASPSQLRSSSPRLHSPASSEIFERNVQEPVPMSTLQSEDTPAHVPTHVMTEDHIPPALGATADAIASHSLNADEVEIITSSSHQPAAEKLEASASHADLTQLHAPPHRHSESGSLDVHQFPSGLDDDGASNYGQLDPNDARRLSFISFADVVQSEHQQQQQHHPTLGDHGSRDSLHIGGHQSSLPSIHERAASPARLPRSPGSMSGGVTTPPPGVTVDFAQDQSPARSNAGAPSPPIQHGDLTIQTIRQAVTASGDVGGVRSPPAMSPNADDASARETRSRTDT